MARRMIRCRADVVAVLSAERKVDDEAD